MAKLNRVTETFKRGYVKGAVPINVDNLMFALENGATGYVMSEAMLSNGGTRTVLVVEISAEVLSKITKLSKSKTEKNG